MKQQPFSKDPLKFQLRHRVLLDEPALKKKVDVRQSIFVSLIVVNLILLYVLTIGVY